MIRYLPRRILQFILKILAKRVIKKFKPEIIGITGSVAKTSTKEAVYAVLKQKYEVGRSEENLNTRIGLPLSILGFKESPKLWQWPFYLILAFFRSFSVKIPKILVLEYAIDLPSNFSDLTSWLVPKIAVVTRIGPAHLEFFKTLEGIADEKSWLVRVLPKDGLAILNEKDKRVREMAKKTKARVLFFSDGEIPQEVAKIIGQIFKVPKKEIKKALDSLKLPLHRMEVIKKKNFIILDDCYNANPLSMEYALKKLSEMSQEFKAKRKIAVLGDMFELGDYSQEGHKEVGKMAKRVCDLLLTTGEMAKLMAQEGKGMHFETKKELINFLEKEVREGDIILVKASRGMKFEEIVKALWNK